MSLYREAGSRSRAAWVVAAFAVVAALAVGFGLGRVTAPDPTADDVVVALKEDLRPVANGLQLLPNEYEQAHSGSGNEAAGVEGALDRIQAGIRAAQPDLRVLAADQAEALASAVDALAEAVRAEADPAEVERLTAAASEALAAVPGGATPAQ